MPRILALAIIIILLLSSSLLYLPLRRELAYFFHISGDTTTSCCDENALGDGDFDENAQAAYFNGEEIEYPKTSLAQSLYRSEGSVVLGTESAVSPDRWIEVSLSQQMLRAWEGNTIVMEFAISSGKWFPTPKGDYNIWYKTRSQTMKGGSKELGTYYYLPNVPHNMFFYKGFALHGAYWHNNFGNPMSHGCVNEPLANAAVLFDWAGPVVPEGKNSVRASIENPGTRVFVH